MARFAALATVLIGGVFVIRGLAGVPQAETKSSNGFSHVVKLKKVYSQGGDRITIDSIRGPSDQRTAGNTYEVTGSYKLTSRDKATLAVFVTFAEPHPEISSEVSRDQTIEVSRGLGQFSLRFKMWHDNDTPHVSFYPAAASGGEPFGGVYF